MSPLRPLPRDDELLSELLQRLDERSCLPGRLLGELIAGTLPSADAADVRVHLRDCLSCLNTFARLQSLHESLSPSEAYEELRRQQPSGHQAGGEPEPRLRLVGDSPSVRRLRLQMSRLAGLDQGPRAAPPLLVAGEIGTGKGVVARVIHDLSRRAARPFIEVGCAVIPPARLPLELFGHEQGAAPASGATTSGLFEAADGGTLFLDGIHAVPLELQVTLIEAIERGSVRRLGGIEAKSLDVWIIAASHVDLEDAVRRGAFRADLLDHLRSSTLVLPPLRERPDDIVPLARYFVGRLPQHHGGPLQLTTDAEERLRRYRWPGNVRELSNVIERAARLGARAEIGAEELGLPRS